MRRIKLKKRKNKLRIRRKLVLTSTLVLLFVLGIGYSALSVDLNINGNITVKEYLKPTLYNVLKREAENNGLAREYTGEHQDSLDPTKSTEKIYHWYASNNTEGTEVQNRNNVIFANRCWQMWRTTDTGGVRMIYNGEVEDGKCLDTRGNHLGFDSNLYTLNRTYYYGTDFIYDKANNLFTLAGDITTGSIPLGTYTCRSSSSTGTCSTLLYVRSFYQDYYSNLYYDVDTISKYSHYSQLGEYSFNTNGSSISSVGYMSNLDYTFSYTSFETETLLSSTSLSTSYWYADSVTYENGKYKLVNPYQVSVIDDSLIGKYTLTSTISSSVNTSALYITVVSGTTGYNVTLSGGNYLDYYNNTYTYGDSYTDNGNGTYTINSPTTFEGINYYSNYEAIKKKYVCKNATNNTCSVVWFLPASDKFKFEYIKSDNNFIYANNFTYDGTNYILDPTNRVQFWELNDTNNQNALNNNHYTCFNDTGVCSKAYYIYNNNDSRGRKENLYYVELNNGESSSDALENMLNSENANQNDSNVKRLMDLWYKHELTAYTSYLEDTIYCDDRTIRNLGNWNPNGGNLTKSLSFNGYLGFNNLFCPNETDRFAVGNNKAKLTYPVGLMTYLEADLLNNANARTSGKDYWLMTPQTAFHNEMRVGSVYENGAVESMYTSNSTFGIRPAISLRPGTEYVSGTGSKDDPYVVNTFKDDDWDTIVNNVRNGKTANYQVGDTKEVDMGEFGTHTLRLVNKSTPSECNNSDFSQSACGFVLEFADIISSTSMNTNFSNAGGWSAMSLRNYVNNDIYNALPTELKGGIIDTKVVSTRGSNDDPSISTDKMFLQTIKELYGLNILDTFGDNTRQLDYYSNLGITGGDIRVARIYNFYNNNYYPFWLRSAMTGSIADFYIINSDGTYGRDYVSNYLGVSPSFRIG